MITVVFWNLAKNRSTLAHVKCLAQLRSVDVFIFAECPRNLKPAIRDLDTLGQGKYYEPSYVKSKIRLVTRISHGEILPRFTASGREMAVWSVRAPNLKPPELLIAAAHLGSKVGGNTPGSQFSVAKEIAAEIAEVEDDRQHRNTVFVGDCNMSPFDPGMTIATGLHGPMTMQLASLPDRLHRGVHYRRFYNPMWAMFGDRTPGPPGTHYWRSSMLENHYWSILDQVLLRPGIASRLHALEIIDSDGYHSLVSGDGAPDKRHLSDHLPICFQIDL